MKTEQVFSIWCQSSVPVLIGHMVQDYIAEGGSFFLEAKTQLHIKGVDGVGFELPVPDNVVDINDVTNVSREGLEIWVGLVRDHIFKIWDNSYNGKKSKLLDDLKSFSIIYPKMAADLLKAVEFKNGEFQFDLTKTAFGEISLMAAKFEDFVEKKNARKN